MAIDFVCITRKIEVHLHRHGNDDAAMSRYKEEFDKWREINNNLYKAANYIVSHSFFNDAFEQRLRIHSSRFNEIEKLLKASKKNKLTDSEIKVLIEERKALLKQFSQQKKDFLQTSEQNSTYKVVSEEFGDIIPSNILTCLNQSISSTYSCFRKDVESGKRTIPNYKKGIPVPFSMTLHNKLQLQRRNDGSIFVRMPMGLEWDLFFGRDRSNNREIVERILSNQYEAGNSSLQEAKNGKVFLLLLVKIPRQNKNLTGIVL